MTSAESPSRGVRGGIGDAVGVVAEGQTYKNLLYLALAFPLAMIYSMLLMLGFMFGAFLSIALVGIAVLIATVLGSRLLAGAERWLANALLGLDLKRSADVYSADQTGLWATVRAYLEAKSTWQGLGFLMLKFWVALTAFILLFLFASVLSLVTAPLRYPHEVEFITVNDQPIVWTIDTLPEALLAVPIGLGLGLAFLHLLNGFAHVCKRMAVALLGEPASSKDASGPTDGAPPSGGDSDYTETKSVSESEPTAAETESTAKIGPESVGASRSRKA
ncbi:sensor domain-containing protein [Halobacteria archaeon AArc-dxtr1]|nr:sensor domain-containing protein [Halobacteria archaeon AArc-dxtr1]